LLQEVGPPARPPARAPGAPTAPTSPGGGRRRARGGVDQPSSRGRSFTAGPSSRAPSAANREPCRGQSHERSTSFQRSTPPRWVQTPEILHVVPSTVDTATGRPRSRPTTPCPSAGAPPGSSWSSALSQSLGALRPTPALTRRAVRTSDGEVTRRPSVSAHGTLPPVISACSAIAAATALLIPHLLYPVAR